MDDASFLIKEYETLQGIIHELKDCQTKYIAISVSFVAAIFGLIASVNAIGKNELLIVTNSTNTFYPQYLVQNTIFNPLYLASLVILIPVWGIFFDKSRTITRIVGYLAVLENFIKDPSIRENHKGWENSLEEFRESKDFEICVKLDVVKDSAWNSIGLCKQVKFFFEVIFVKTGQYQRYWSWVYATYFWLSIISIIMFLYFNNFNYNEFFKQIYNQNDIFIMIFCLGSLIGIFFTWREKWLGRVILGFISFPLLFVFIGHYFTLLTIAVFLILLIAKNNVRILYNLIFGFNSYEANYYYWNYVLIEYKKERDNVLYLLKRERKEIDLNKIEKRLKIPLNRLSYIIFFLEKNKKINVDPSSWKKNYDCYSKNTFDNHKINGEDTKTLITLIR